MELGWDLGCKNNPVCDVGNDVAMYVVSLLNLRFLPPTRGPRRYTTVALNPSNNYYRINRMSIVNRTELQRPMPALKITESVRQQRQTEMECDPFFVDLQSLPKSQIQHLRESGLLSKSDSSSLDICLLVDRHVEYLEKLWRYRGRPQLPKSFTSLDASRTWMVYWTVHACDLLEHIPNDDDCEAIIDTIASCFTPVQISLPGRYVRNDPVLSAAVLDEGDLQGIVKETIEVRAGGFGGGPGQIPHAAPTYAAVMSLCILASQNRAKNKLCSKALKLLESIRIPFYAWAISVMDPNDGSMRMHNDGEVDVRASYCILAVTGLLNLLKAPTIINSRIADFVASCQTWEGGFGGEPWAEAHGGYTFCALAALQLLKKVDVCNLEAVADFVSRRQMPMEGGFNGRSNKLVDGCYSFWQGGALAIASALLTSDQPDCMDDPWLKKESHPNLLLFDQAMLERYILLCAQEVHGGLRDKPSKVRDFYHTCYNLSGLSVAQHYDNSAHFGHTKLSRVAKTHPCYNIRTTHVEYILDHFTTSQSASW